MSNFYYCNDCKSDCDLILPSSETYISLKIEHVCKKCGGTNWHAEIDKGTHYEQVKE